MKPAKRHIYLIIVISFFLFPPLLTFGQKLTYKGFPSLTWPVLYDVEYKPGIEDMQKPIFSQKTKGLQGKTISLPGYLVPFSSGLKSKNFVVSSLPLNACFFCGVGGPETVVQVFSVEEVKYTDKPIEIRGILKLNDSDPDKMIYILENANLVGELDL